MSSSSTHDVWKFSTFLLAALIVGFLLSQFLSSADKVMVVNPQLPGDAPAPAPIFFDVDEDDDAFLGNPDAPITMIEFSDFQCPYCGRFFAGTLPAIVREYVDTGKVKLVYRDFPLDFHPAAIPAAEAAECAGEQGQFFAMHDRVFVTLSDWSTSVNPAFLFKQYAGELGLNQSAFDSCLDNHDMLDEVRADIRAGISAGVSGTPTFFINGQKIVGAQPYSVFSGLFESILNTR